MFVVFRIAIGGQAVKISHPCYQITEVGFVIPEYISVLDAPIKNHQPVRPLMSFAHDPGQPIRFSGIARFNVLAGVVENVYIVKVRLLR
jgi:hypothetical protein